MDKTMTQIKDKEFTKNKTGIHVILQGVKMLFLLISFIIVNVLFCKGKAGVSGSSLDVLKQDYEGDVYNETLSL